MWDRVLTVLQTEAAFTGTLDGSLAMTDGTNVRAHQQAAGAKEGVPNQNSDGAAVAGGANSTS